LRKSQPDNFDWRVFLLLSKVRDESDNDNSTNSPISDIKDIDSVTHPYPPQELKRMNRAATLAAIFSAVIGIVVWPLLLYRDYIFGKLVSPSFPVYRDMFF
jgi:hypothetical protein